tara:strand:- start:237 stop:467 length:231 start_codon:yes stop_codon:yes gene_type:complete
MKDTVFEVLKSHFGADKEINESSHLMDDLGGDEFDIVDVIIQIEEKLNISIPEEETFELMVVSELLEVVERHVESD